MTVVYYCSCRGACYSILLQLCNIQSQTSRLTYQGNEINTFPSCRTRVIIIADHGLGPPISSRCSSMPSRIHWITVDLRPLNTTGTADYFNYVEHLVFEEDMKYHAFMSSNEVP